MALSDTDKDVLGWVSLVPGFLEMLGDLTGEASLKSAAKKLKSIPTGSIAEVLGAMRTDHVNIEGGSMEIGDGVDVEVID
tara:strand:+ start:83 stop:322 length:240 start_codon:yes stop_codon:yes gene_type:complete